MTDRETNRKHWGSLEVTERAVTHNCKYMSSSPSGQDDLTENSTKKYLQAYMGPSAEFVNDIVNA